jgi:hypothetical protein
MRAFVRTSKFDSNVYNCFLASKMYDAILPARVTKAVEENYSTIESYKIVAAVPFSDTACGVAAS